MADFCKQCSIDLFSEDYRELAGQCQKGEMVAAICEGCGFIWVDHNGACMGGEPCAENHQPEENGDGQLDVSQR